MKEEEDDKDGNDESRFKQDQSALNATAVHKESDQENDEDVDREDEFTINDVAVSSTKENGDERVDYAPGDQTEANGIKESVSEVNTKSVSSEAALRTELEAKSNELESAQEENIRLRGEVRDLKAVVQLLSNVIQPNH